MNPNFFNLSQRKKRDVLSDLLLGKSTEGIISKKELNALNKLIERPPVEGVADTIKSKPAEKAKVSVAQKKEQGAKKRRTHYLSPEVSEDLDKIHMAIRSLVPENLRATISKSHIVNQSLAIILQEFAVKGKKSRLMRTIISKT